MSKTVNLGAGSKKCRVAKNGLNLRDQKFKIIT